MYQFFVNPGQIQGHLVTIEGTDVNHIKNVLRMKPGEEIAVSNGRDGREYRCAIEKLEEEQIICRLLFMKEDGVELPARVYLFQGLPKADKMELIIQKAVELGAFEIIPVETKRAVVKLDAKKAAGKTARWNAIAQAAAKQSKRRVIPTVTDCMNFKEAVDYAKEMELKLIPYELSEGMDETRRQIESVRAGWNVAVFIGPEGGFTEEEIELAREAGIVPVTLGKRILRTETAGFTVLSWLMYRLEGQT